MSRQSIEPTFEYAFVIPVKIDRCRACTAHSYARICDFLLTNSANIYTISANIPFINKIKRIISQFFRTIRYAMRSLYSYFAAHCFFSFHFFLLTVLFCFLVCSIVTAIDYILCYKAIWCCDDFFFFSLVSFACVRAFLFVALPQVPPIPLFFIMFGFSFGSFIPFHCIIKMWQTKFTKFCLNACHRCR